MEVNSFEDYDLWVAPLWNDPNIFSVNTTPHKRHLTNITTTKNNEAIENTINLSNSRKIQKSYQKNTYTYEEDTSQNYISKKDVEKSSLLSYFIDFVWKSGK